jgi:hypothetical protein
MLFILVVQESNFLGQDINKLRSHVADLEYRADRKEG